MSLDNILDATLDDLADAPSITLWPNGAHKANLEFKTDEKNPSNITLTMTYVEPLELADPTSLPPQKDDKNFVFFRLKNKDGKPNEYSQGALKEVLKSLQPVVGGSTLSEVMANAKGVEVAVVTKIRVSKDPQYSDQIDIKKIEAV
jgi:hypothetical protein